MYARRRERLRSELAARDVDAALISSLVNVRYLTGLDATNAALLVTRESEVLATDGRYADQAHRQADGVEVVRATDCARALVELALTRQVRSMAYEAHVVTVEEHATLEAAAGALPMVALGRAVERLRVTKDESEIEHLRAACAVGDRALADLLTQLRPGLTERHVAGLLEGLMREHGSEGLSFATIVATGANSAVPHHQPTDAVLADGDLLKIDFGAVMAGYHSDMTRTFVIGRAPAAWQQEIYSVVEAAQRAGREALAAGCDVRDVDRAARSVVEAAGYGPAFMHGLGHGVGLEIHEAPLLSGSAEGILEAGTPVTVEPGVYLPGRGGVRIEDTLVVRDGVPDLLTQSPRQLLVLG